MLEIINKHWCGLEPVLTAKTRLPPIRYEPNLIESSFRQRLQRITHEAVNYFRVSPQLHLLNLGMVGGETVALWALGPSEGIVAMSGAFVIALGILNTIKGFANLATYLEEYERLKSRGWSEWIIAPRTRTLCDRNATRIAAIDAGFGEEITMYYKRAGINGLFPIG
jgi:hypothetical protein